LPAISKKIDRINRIYRIRSKERNVPLTVVEKRLVTPEKAGVQETRFMQINALLDAGLRRHDEFMVATAIFNELLKVCCRF
jgi:hypothetical protein